MKTLIRIQFLTILGSLLILLTKAVAYFLTGSNAILSDVLESCINVVAGSFALYSLKVASRPRDENHPYGHGKIEFLSATLEGSLIIMAGILIIGKSIYNFVFPYEVHQLDVGIYLTAIAGLFNFFIGGVLVYQGKKNHSMTMEADGKHLLSDAYSTVGMILGLGIVYFTNLYWIDNLIAMIFGLIISITGVQILKKSIAGIMDEADEKLLGSIVRTLQENRKENWIDLHNLRVIKYGSILHLDCHMTLPWFYDNRESHTELDEIEKLIKHHYGDQAEMFIHTDPCKDNSCRLCQLSSCDVRKNTFETTLVWTVKNVLSDAQHELRS
ncbi:MAG TPA: cation diffusion facilitator family transporter [Flavobacteriales bacterium]|nr:cation diffusion facilitator family transporter [Flavobacteriales bacterium]